MAEKSVMFACLIGGFALGGGTFALFTPTSAAPPSFTVVIGQQYPCKAEINSAVWGDMNRMGVYRWVAACEQAEIGGGNG